MAARPLTVCVSTLLPPLMVVLVVVLLVVVVVAVAVVLPLAAAAAVKDDCKRRLTSWYSEVVGVVAGRGRKVMGRSVSLTRSA